MNARFMHPAARGKAEQDDVLATAAAAAAMPVESACCCPAWPVVQVIMPATANRPHETDLLLCAHHFRVSQRALDAAGAVVIELPGRADDVLLGAVPAQAVAAS